MRDPGLDPGPALEAAFRRIEAERMAGVALLNPALRVQAVDFALCQGHWLGALLTPWFLNLVRLPGPGGGAPWQPAREGERQVHRFGAGDFAFLGGSEPEVGEFQACSLVSPMHGFADQATALATARAALRMLHVAQPAAALAGVPAPAGSAPGPSAREAAPSRRALLLGRAGR